MHLHASNCAIVEPEMVSSTDAGQIARGEDVLGESMFCGKMPSFLSEAPMTRKICAESVARYATGTNSLNLEQVEDVHGLVVDRLGAGHAACEADDVVVDLEAGASARENVRCGHCVYLRPFGRQNLFVVPQVMRWSLAGPSGGARKGSRCDLDPGSHRRRVSVRDARLSRRWPTTI
jgi:hypothetical protein